MARKNNYLTKNVEDRLRALHLTGTLDIGPTSGNLREIFVRTRLGKTGRWLVLKKKEKKTCVGLLEAL